jgi:uncharacterized membrane protein
LNTHPFVPLPVLLLLPCTLLLHYLPQLFRPGLFFGVTVPKDFRRTPAARRLVRRFRIALWGCTAAALGFGLAWHANGWVLPLVSTLYGIGTVASAAATHHGARRYAVAAPTAVDIDLAAPTERLPGGVSAIALPFVVLLLLGIWAETHIGRLPARLPVHSGLSGPDRWIPTTPAAVLALLLQTGFVCALMAASAWAVLHWSRRIAAAGTAAAAERRFRRRIAQLLLTCEYFLALPPVLAMLNAPPAASAAWAAALFATIAVFALGLARTGQGGSRHADSGADAPLGDRTADACWKLGMIYFNRSDPALLVEKRMGIGYTVNFANPWAWVVLAVLAGVPIVLRLVLGG